MSTVATTSDATRRLCLAAAALAGVLMALQSRVNGQLSHTLGFPVQAALWSFGSGLVVLLAIMALPSQRVGLARTVRAIRSGELTWWVLLAGVFGAVLVIVQSSVVPLVGVALFSVSVVAGQTLGGLITDAVGMGPGGVRRASARRVVGSLAALTGVAVAASSAGLGTLGWPAALAVVAGVGTSVQSAWNGRTTLRSQVPLATTTINFAVGTIVIVVAFAAQLRLGERQAVSLHGPWWVWWGGLLGLVFVAITTVVVRHIGVLVFTLVALVTQLVSALVLDLFTADLAASGWQRVLGICLTGVGAAVAGFNARRPR